MVRVILTNLDQAACGWIYRTLTVKVNLATSQACHRATSRHPKDTALDSRPLIVN